MVIPDERRALRRERDPLAVGRPRRPVRLRRARRNERPPRSVRMDGEDRAPPERWAVARVREPTPVRRPGNVVRQHATELLERLAPEAREERGWLRSRDVGDPKRRKMKIRAGRDVHDVQADVPARPPSSSSVNARRFPSGDHAMLVRSPQKTCRARGTARAFEGGRAGRPRRSWRRRCHHRSSTVSSDGPLRSRRRGAARGEVCRRRRCCDDEGEDAMASRHRDRRVRRRVGAGPGRSSSRQRSSRPSANAARGATARSTVARTAITGSCEAVTRPLTRRRA